jgi:hypothetical protein
LLSSQNAPWRRRHPLYARDSVRSLAPLHREKGMSDLNDWPLILRTGYGNIFKQGRWTHGAIVLIAEAINSDARSAWDSVEAWARRTAWDDLTAC